MLLWRFASNKLDVLEMSSKDPTWLSWAKTGPQLVIGTARGNLIIYNKRTGDATYKSTGGYAYAYHISCDSLAYSL